MNQPTELLYKFHTELNKPFSDKESLLAYSLDLMAKYLKLDQICFFNWNQQESVMSLRLVWRDHVFLESEEEIYVSAHSALHTVLDGKGVHVSEYLDYPAIYLPVKWFGEARADVESGEENFFGMTGVLRLERFKKSWAFSTREKEIAKGLAEELSSSMTHAELVASSRQQLSRARTLTELTGVFASSLRSDDGMKTIMQGIQKYFGFDRVRLYMVNQKEQKLKGELSVDLSGNVRSLSHEEIPLRAGAHRFADIVLGNSGNTVSDKYRDTVLYLPLTVQTKRVGLLIVDNLLSQQSISQSDMMSLSSFAGQIALAVDNAMLFDRVQELSLYDELTKLPMRRYFNDRFSEEMYRAERFSQPMALIWMDVDYFKDVNDTYGHAVGDAALKEISRVIFANLRKIDFPCRYGGDEIIIMLPQSTAFEARAIANRLSQEIKDIRIPVSGGPEGGVRLSVSQGVATYPADASSGEELLHCADEALYWVKTRTKGTFALYGETVAAEKKTGVARPDNKGK